MNKPKVGDKIYSVEFKEGKSIIEEKEIFHHEIDLYSYNDTYLLEDDTWVSSTKDIDTFIQIEPIITTENKFFYRTEDKAIQKAIETDECYIIEYSNPPRKEHEQILKDLENEISRNK